MKLASYITNGRSSFGIVEGDSIADIGSLVSKENAYLRDALVSGKLTELAARKKDAPSLKLQQVTLLPVIPNPEKILCIGLNYDNHRRETGRAESKYPAIFVRFANSQLAHGAKILRPKVSDKLDYEGELAVIIGRRGKHIREEDAFSHVAGYACYNDATIRDWQGHTHQFTPGKNFRRTGGFGPFLVTADEIPDVTELNLTARLNGTVMQEASLKDLIFSIPHLIAYCSTFTDLEPGDVISTGTPGGVGFKRTPPVYMKAGDTIEVEISKVGTLSNGVEDEGA